MRSAWPTIASSMEYTMASFKSTTTAAFTTVTTTLDTAVKAVNTVAIGIDMLEAYAQAELADQKRSYKLNEATRVAEQVEEAKRRLAQVGIESATFIKKSEEHAAAYKAAASYIDTVAGEMGYENLPKISVS